MGGPPKIGVFTPPKSSIFIGFSIYAIHFGGFPPYFWVDTHIFSTIYPPQQWNASGWGGGSCGMQLKMLMTMVLGLYIYQCQMCQGLNSQIFHIIGDGHQPNSRGLYTHDKDSY